MCSRSSGRTYWPVPELPELVPPWLEPEEELEFVALWLELPLPEPPEELPLPDEP
jgi:hypothetical protein